jgi:hypothetical protein
MKLVKLRKRGRPRSAATSLQGSTAVPCYPAGVYRCLVCPETGWWDLTSVQATCIAAYLSYHAFHFPMSVGQIGAEAESCDEQCTASVVGSIRNCIRKHDVALSCTNITTSALLRRHPHWHQEQATRWFSAVHSPAIHRELVSIVACSSLLSDGRGQSSSTALGNPFFLPCFP